MKNPNDEIRRLREAFHQAILADLRERVLSYHSIAVKHGTTVTLVYNLARANDCQRRASKAQAAQEFSQQQQENNKNKRTQSTKSETKSENPSPTTPHVTEEKTAEGGGDAITAVQT